MAISKDSPKTVGGFEAVAEVKDVQKPIAKDDDLEVDEAVTKAGTAVGDKVDEIVNKETGATTIFSPVVSKEAEKPDSPSKKRPSPVQDDKPDAKKVAVDEAGNSGEEAKVNHEADVDDDGDTEEKEETEGEEKMVDDEAPADE